MKRQIKLHNSSGEHQARLSMQPTAVNARKTATGKTATAPACGRSDPPAFVDKKVGTDYGSEILTVRWREA